MNTRVPLADAVAETSPYVGLSYFTEGHAELFFGREAERTTIIGNLRAARLTLLYAESGVGKSSLLRAGVQARLLEIARRTRTNDGGSRYIPVVFASWRDEPIAELIREISGAIEPFLGPDAAIPLPAEDLPGAIERASSATGATLLVILDQFEEYFLYGSGETHAGSFADALARCVNDREVRANFLIAVREDAYAGLGSLFRERIVNVYANFLRLERLGRGAARSAIVGPVERYNSVHPAEEAVDLEPALIEAVLDQVRQGSVSFDGAGRGSIAERDGDRPAEERIETPYLQLVMSTLWERERAEGSRVLRRSTLDALGGAREIAHAHLNGALNRLPAAQRETAVEVFDHLVTPSGTKIVHKVSDLARYAARPASEVETLVETLASGRERILRPVPAPPGEETDGGRVEIFHDVLAPAILAWRAGQTAARLEAEKLEAEAQASRERRRARMFRMLSVVSGTLLIVAVAGFVLARIETSRARTAERSAVSLQLAHEAQTELGSGALAQGVLLSMEAYRYANTPQSRYSLVRALAATQAMQSTFPDYSSAVTTVAFRPDGRVLATGDAAGTIVLEDEASGRPVATLPGSSSINDVAYSPNGAMLAAADQAGAIVLWNPQTRRVLRRIDPHAGAINAIAFSPGGGLLASANADDTVTLWNPLTGQRLRTLHGHTAAVEDVAFSPDGRLLASGSDDHTVILWDPSNGRRIRTLRGHTAGITAVAFAPGGGQLAASSNDDTIIVWNVADGRELHVLRGSTSYVDDVAYSPDGTTIASAGDDDQVRLYDARTGAMLRVLRGHSAPVDSLAYNPSGTLLASSGQDDLVIQWYARPPLLRRTFTGDTQQVFGVAVSRNGQLIASAGEDGTVRIWDASTGRLIHVLRGHAGPVEAVAFSPNGTELASADADHTVIEWNVASGALLRTLRGDTDIVYAVAYSPNGREIASGSADDSTIVWNAATGQRMATLVGHTDYVDAVTFSPSGRTLATGSADKSIILWSVGNHRRIRTLTGDTNTVEALAFSPNGRQLASASLDGTVMLWNVATGRPIGQPLRGHNGGVISVAFSPDGRTLASGGVDDSVIVWDVRSQLGEPFVTQSGPVSSLAYTDGGASLVSGSVDGTVDLLGPVPASLTAQAVDRRLCGVVRRNLTSAEWRAFVPGQAYQATCPGSA